MEIRTMQAQDYDQIMRHLDEWWGGRNMAHQLPRLFLKYFSDTCLVAKEDGEIAGFLIGFFAQSEPDIAYVHFLGVNPAYRRQKLGRGLYEHFFRLTAQQGKTRICAVTSTVNRLSHQFHTGLGFAVLPGDSELDGISFTANYDGIGEHRFLFALQNPYC